MEVLRTILIIVVMLIVVSGAGCFEYEDGKMTIDFRGTPDIIETRTQDAIGREKPLNTTTPLDRDGDQIADSIDECPDVWGNMPNGCYEKISLAEEKCRFNVERKMKVTEEKLPFRPSNPTIVEIRKFSSLKEAEGYLSNFNIYPFLLTIGEFKEPIYIAIARWNRDVPSPEGRTRYFHAYYCNLNGELAPPKIYQPSQPSWEFSIS